MATQQATTTGGWKKLVANPDTMSFVKNRREYSIIIEARHYDTGWEIVRRYVGEDVNFTEQYSAGTSQEAGHLIKRLKGERELSTAEIKTITQYRKKAVKLDLKRVYQERHVEKWSFAFANTFNNFATVHNGRTINIDIVMEERLKYLEEKIVMKLFESFGLDETDQDTEVSIFYYTKKTKYFFENEEEEIVLS